MTVLGERRRDGSYPDGAPASRGEDHPRKEDAPHPPRRWWRIARSVLSLALLAVAVVFIVLRFKQMANAGKRLEHVHPGWILLALVAEAGSMVVFARLQQRLLQAGKNGLPLRTMVGITLAANAVTGTIPGGVGWAAAWQFEQLGRRGVPRFLRVWMFLVAGGISSFALFVVVATGIETAGGQGPVASLRWPALALAAIPVLVLGLELFHHSPAGRRMGGWAVAEVDSHVPGGRWAHRTIRSLVGRFSAVRLGLTGWIEVFLLALANWLLDCLVIVAALEALRVPVPWSAILVIYGLTQISAAFPITPGGIGVVAGSMAALLHAYGVPTESALAVVVLYRLLSFWILVPIGWGVWGWLEVTTRNHPEHRSATEAQPTLAEEQT